AHLLHTAEASHEMVLEGQFFVHNVGASDAILKKEYSEIFIGNYLPAINPYFGKHGRELVDVLLKPGESTAITFPTVKLEQTYRHFRQWQHFMGRTGIQGGPNSSELFLIGWIRYADSSGRERVFGYSRKFDWLTQRFKRIQDEDYEYD